MKLVHKDISTQIDFDINPCQQLVIENSKEFLSKTNEMFQQTNGTNGNFVLSSNNTEIDLSKNSLFIFDYYNNLLNTKKAINAINNKAVEILKHEDFIEDFAMLNSVMLKINARISEQFNCPLTYLEGIDFANFVKISSYKAINTENIIENILTYIQICCETQNIMLVTFVNLSSILTAEEIKNLAKQLNYMQISLLLIESHKKYLLETFNTIIDEDLCII